MHIRRPSWKLTGISVFVAASLGFSVLVPAMAASSHVKHDANHAKAKKKGANYGTNFKQQKCKKKVTPKGTLKWSDWQFPGSLNQFQTSASVATENYDNLMDGLVTFDPTAAAKPDMLAALPTIKNGGIKNGGKTIVAHLKKGMRWSNGAEITSADVKFGWQIGMSKTTGPWCAGVNCDQIARIDTPDKYTMIFHLKNVFAPFISGTLYNGAMPVEPVAWPGAWAKGDVEGAAKKLFQDTTFNYENDTFPTNGPYQVQQFTLNDRIVYKPNKYYNILTCGAHLQSLIFAFYSSKPDLIAAAAAGNTDSTTDYTLADLPELYQHSSSLNIHADPGFLIEHLTLNTDPQYNGKPNPLHDVRVRQALALALDKYGLIESALGMNKKQASAIISWTPLIVTPRLVQPYADKSLKGQWDPIAKKYIVNTGTGQALADAKKLLAQAGYSGGGFTLDADTTSGNPVRQAQFAVIQKNWQQVGVGFNAVYVPASKFFSDWGQGSPLNHGDFQVAMFADVLTYADPNSLNNTVMSKFVDRDQTVHSAINGNFAGIRDPLIDKAFTKGAATFNKKVRQKWYTAWQVRMNKQAYWIDLFYRGSINTDNGRIRYYTTNPTNLGEEWNTWAWAVKGGKT